MQRIFQQGEIQIAPLSEIAVIRLTKIIYQGSYQKLDTFSECLKYQSNQEELVIKVMTVM